MTERFLSQTIHLCETTKNDKTTFLVKTWEGGRTLGFVKCSKSAYEHIKRNAHLDSFITRIKRDIYGEVETIRHFCVATLPTHRISTFF